MILFSFTQVKTVRSSAPLYQRDPLLLIVSVTGERLLEYPPSLLCVLTCSKSPWLCVLTVFFPKALLFGLAFLSEAQEECVFFPKHLPQNLFVLGENISLSTNHSKHLALSYCQCLLIVFYLYFWLVKFVLKWLTHFFEVHGLEVEASKGKFSDFFNWTVLMLLKPW